VCRRISVLCLALLTISFVHECNSQQTFSNDDKQFYIFKTKNTFQENNVRVHIPPPSVQKDEIVVTGEKDGVAAAVTKIKAIYNKKVSIIFTK